MGLDFFRRGAWLDAARTRSYLWIFAALNVVALAVLFVTSRGGIDRNGFLLGTDFLSFWTTGTMLQEEGNVYDVAAHTAAQRGFFAQDGAYTAFFYPPLFLPFCWPLGLLGYFPALGLWLGTTGAAYLLTVRSWLKRAGLAQPSLLLFVAFPPVLVTVTHGQTSFLLSAFLGLGALLVRERPWIAGALLGLATIKPQFGLLVPIALLLTREWRVIAAAMGSAAVLGMVATFAFGPEVWGDWLQVSSAAQSAMDDGMVGYAKMQSLFAAAMLLGAPQALAYSLQAAFTLVVVVAVGWASRGRRYDLSIAALMLAGAPLVTPFVLDYDMTLLAFPLIWLAAQGFGPWEKFASVLTFIVAAFARPLALAVGIPITPAVLLFFFVVLLRRVRYETRGIRVPVTE